MDLVSPDQLAAFRSSGAFDEDWYVDQYPDVRMLGMDPLEHYLWVGAKIGRRPSPLIEARDDQQPWFDALKLQPSLEERAQLLARSKLLDVEYVCKQLGLPACDRLEAARLYYGAFERRQLKPNPLFDPAYYRHANGLERGADPVWHYLEEGALRHLPFHRLFDVDWYESQMPDAKYAADLIAHYWEIGYPQKLLPIDEQQLPVIPQIRELFFLREPGDAHEEFSVSIYRECNRDLNHLDDRGLAQHYLELGKSEGRFGSVSEIFAAAGARPYFIPLDFTPEAYAEVHLDLAEGFKDGFWNYLSHYLLHGLTEGRAYNLSDLFGYYPLCQQTFSTECLSSIEKKPLCVLMHLYYPEMWSELHNYLLNIEVPFDLYVNLVDTTWTTKTFSRIRKDCPDARIIISENSGRDIGGFVRLLDLVDFDRYVAFATVHSKKSPHVTRNYAQHWLSNLLDATLGSADTVNQNLAAFIEDETIGIIGSAKHRNDEIGKNEATLNHFLDLYRIDSKNRQCEYVSGTMMMVRSEIMKTVYAPLREYDFESGDGKGLEFHIDGQAEHAVERIFGNVAKQLGYRFLWR